MQQNMSIGVDQLNESYILGERYDLGKLEATYHIEHTPEDLRRYHRRIALNVFKIVYAVFAVICIYLWFTIWYPTSDFPLPLIFLVVLVDVFFILLNGISRQKWGNRPLIGPRDRHLRVYVYEGGIVKRTDRSCDVMHWVELKKVSYEPARVGRWFNPYPNDTHIAGIKLRLYGRSKLIISGALQNIDELVDRLKRMRDLYR